MGTKDTGAMRPFRILMIMILSISIGWLWIPSVSSQDGETIRSLFENGQRAFDEGRYQDAIHYFEEVIHQNNSFAWAYHALGLVYNEISSDPNYPLWYFQTAIQIDPQFAPAYDMLCRSYYQQQRYLEAETVCLKALELSPDLLSSQLSLAWVYLIGRSDADRAIHYFERISGQIDTPFIHFGQGMAYAMQGDHARVLEVVTRLRAQGMEEFAVHLEAVLRSRTPPEQFMPPGVIRHEPQGQERDEIVQKLHGGDAGYRIVPVPIFVAPAGMSGDSDIHIKGKIRPPLISVSTPEQATRGGQQGRHPGGLSK